MEVWVDLEVSLPSTTLLPSPSSLPTSFSPSQPSQSASSKSNESVLIKGAKTPEGGREKGGGRREIKRDGMEGGREKKVGGK